MLHHVMMDGTHEWSISQYGRLCIRKMEGRSKVGINKENDFLINLKKTTKDFQLTSTYRFMIVGVIVKSGSEPLNLLLDRSLHSNMAIYQHIIFNLKSTSQSLKEATFKHHEHLHMLSMRLKSDSRSQETNLALQKLTQTVTCCSLWDLAEVQKTCFRKGLCIGGEEKGSMHQFQSISTIHMI